MDDEQRDAIDELRAAQIALNATDLDLRTAIQRQKAAESAVADAMLMNSSARRRAQLAEQIAASYERGSERDPLIWEHRRNLRTYIRNRGPVEEVTVRGVSAKEWSKLSADSKRRLTDAVLQRETGIEQDILDGKRDDTGEYVEAFQYLKFEEASDIIFPDDLEYEDDIVIVTEVSEDDILDLLGEEPLTPVEVITIIEPEPDRREDEVIDDPIPHTPIFDRLALIQEDEDG